MQRHRQEHRDNARPPGASHGLEGATDTREQIPCPDLRHSPRRQADRQTDVRQRLDLHWPWRDYNDQSVCEAVGRDEKRPR
eukprot:7865364-Pyramimonas_sp.AAC.1